MGTTFRLTRFFSEKKEKKELGLLDKINKASYKIMPKSYLEGQQELARTGKSDKYAKRQAIYNGLGAAIGGLGAGAVFAPKGSRLKWAGLAGLATGTGAALGGYIGGKSAGVLVKNNKAYREQAQRQADLIDVSKGKMSESEFLKKWDKK